MSSVAKKVRDIPIVYPYHGAGLIVVDVLENQQLFTHVRRLIEGAHALKSKRRMARHRGGSQKRRLAVSLPASSVFPSLYRKKSHQIRLTVQPLFWYPLPLFFLHEYFALRNIKSLTAGLYRRISSGIITLNNRTLQFPAPIQSSLVSE